jgi:hypothetical protein
VDLPTEMLITGREIVFTFFWKKVAKWEGRNYEVRVE